MLMKSPQGRIKYNPQESNTATIQVVVMLEWTIYCTRHMLIKNKNYFKYV